VHDVWIAQDGSPELRIRRDRGDVEGGEEGSGRADGHSIRKGNRIRHGNSHVINGHSHSHGHWPFHGNRFQPARAGRSPRWRKAGWELSGVAHRLPDGRFGLERICRQKQIGCGTDRGWLAGRDILALSNLVSCRGGKDEPAPTTIRI
jgi:hypothetical protein